MIDGAASSKAPNDRSSGLLARVKIDFESCRLEASQNYRVRVMPETNGVWSLTFTHRAWNILQHRLKLRQTVLRNQEEVSRDLRRLDPSVCLFQSNSQQFSSRSFVIR